eukprot:365747-Chlamydomonas_euryale.AAC.48
MVLFVGDFGNEVVGLVAKIAALELPKAVILGNHDAWCESMPGMCSMFCATPAMLRFRLECCHSCTCR